MVTAVSPETERLADCIRAYLGRLDARVTYGALARALDVPGPGSIARVTSALEYMMRQDAAAGRPFAAAQVVGRAGRGLPGRGFFELAGELGRGPAPGQSPEAFHAAEVAALQRAPQYGSEAKPY